MEKSHSGSCDGALHKRDDRAAQGCGTDTWQPGKSGIEYQYNGIGIEYQYTDVGIEYQYTGVGIESQVFVLTPLMETMEPIRYLVLNTSRLHFK